MAARASESRERARRTRASSRARRRADSVAASAVRSVSDSPCTSAIRWGSTPESAPTGTMIRRPLRIRSYTRTARWPARSRVTFRLPRSARRSRALREHPESTAASVSEMMRSGSIGVGFRRPGGRPCRYPVRVMPSARDTVPLMCHAARACDRDGSTALHPVWSPGVSHPDQMAEPPPRIHVVDDDSFTPTRRFARPLGTATVTWWARPEWDRTGSTRSRQTHGRHRPAMPDRVRCRWQVFAAAWRWTTRWRRDV